MAERQHKSVKPNKSLRTLNPEQTHNSQLNNSISKMQFSFSKSPRFSEQKHKIDTRFYDVPTTLAKRSTSLGYGNKVDLADSHNTTPSPTKYHLHSDFQGKTGISFGLGRQQVKANSVFGESGYSMPAPGAYNPRFRDKQLKYSMRQKLEDHSTKWIRQIPGPGSYNSAQLINEQGRNFDSKYQTPPTAKFSILPRLIKDTFPMSPGPAKYEMNRYSGGLSKFHSPVSNKFSLSKRKGPSDQKPYEVPGPGQYRVFSEFLL